MQIKCFRVENFRRLKSARVDLERERTIFVGANNSGKTSATHLFQMFLSQQPRAPFQVYDFTADCWEVFDSIDVDDGEDRALSHLKVVNRHEASPQRELHAFVETRTR